MDMTDEVPKYRKKKSRSSKASSKSSHKHSYEDCLLIDAEEHPRKACYCTICGKLTKVQFFTTRKTDAGSYLVLEDAEVFAMYKKLRRFNVEDCWQKYIAINK